MPDSFNTIQRHGASAKTLNSWVALSPSSLSSSHLSPSSFCHEALVPGLSVSRHALSTTRLMAADNRLHDSCSRVNCARPAAVSE